VSKAATAIVVEDRITHFAYFCKLNWCEISHPTCFFEKKERNLRLWPRGNGVLLETVYPIRAGAISLPASCEGGRLLVLEAGRLKRGEVSDVAFKKTGASRIEIAASLRSSQ